MVFSSSCTVYGMPDVVPITEEAPLKAISPYGRTKLFQVGYGCHTGFPTTCQYVNKRWPWTPAVLQVLAKASSAATVTTMGGVRAGTRTLRHGTRRRAKRLGCKRKCGGQRVISGPERGCGCCGRQQ